MKKCNMAIIGLSHIHVTNLVHDFMRYTDRVEIIGMADVPPFSEKELQEKIERNVPKDVEIPFYRNYKELLDLKPDIALICTDVKDHAAIAEEILGQNIVTIVEKPMALEMKDAKRMYRASQRSRAELIINWPIAWFPTFSMVKHLVEKGDVGKVLRVHYRSPSTRGPYPLNAYSPEELSKMWWYQHERGGGSICDYAGYGCVLATWLTGSVAKRVSGFKKNFFLPFSDVEDYSVFTIDFGDSVGLIEGSWSTMSNGEIPTGPVVYGEKGVIVADRYSQEVKLYRELAPYVASPHPDEVFAVEASDLGLAWNVLEFLQNDKPLNEMVTVAFNMKAMAAFDAGRRSCETGAVEWTEDPFQY
ncbi:MAG: Gfo/Idh/MocA family oxidoreductase [Eubacteriales bacterium]|nr:Gfo/Idh/MocA family oxidoreductase [Eubacteriales bacterium]